MFSSSAQSTSAPSLTRLTPVLVVDAVEPCLQFWIDRFGFTAENQVPGKDGTLMIAVVKKGEVEVTYQTRASVIAERPESAAELVGHLIALFITTDDLDAVERAIEGVPVVAARHPMFYGSTEIYVREPGGKTVGFAPFAS